MLTRWPLLSKSLSCFPAQNAGAGRVFSGTWPAVTKRPLSVARSVKVPSGALGLY